MQNNYSSLAERVLKHATSQIQQRKALQSQHRYNMSKALRVTRNRLKSSENQNNTAAKRLGGGQRGVTPLRATLFAKNCLFRAHQQAPQ